MTEQKLEQLISLKQEIKILSKKIQKLSCTTINMTSDKVQASMSEFPYISTYVNIIGGDRQQDNIINKAVNIEKKILKDRLKKAKSLEKEIRVFIMSIDDSQIRQIIEYRYIDDLTWQEVGNIMNMDRTTVHKKLKRYLSNTNK